MRKENGKRFTNYYTAVGWIDNKVLCNSLPEIDQSVYDNMRFMLEDEDENQRYIYQWFITDCNKSDVEYLEKSFGLLFTYSDILDCWVLCVDHIGTPWKGVEVEVKSNDIPDSVIESHENK